MKRGWQWPLLVSLALLFTVGVNVVMLFAAKGDPNGTVVEPDYYRKAVEWDRAMARQSASDALGWTATAELGASSDASRLVRVVLRDSAGVAVPAADVRVTLIHNAEAAKLVEGALEVQPNGDYTGTFLAPHAGRWEVRVTARRGEERFLTTLHTEAP
jgi:nitrogen fixation protein FixH